MSEIIIFLIFCGAYVVGSIPTGYIIARLKGIHDIRQHGSGNIGATNVARVLGLPYFFLIFFIDAFKAYVYMYISLRMGFSSPVLLGISILLVCGNAFPLFLDLRGGKGVATSFGIVLAHNPFLVCISVLIWIIMLLITRVVGIASVMALVCVPFVALCVVPSALYTIYFVTFTAVFGVFLHRDNIRKFVRI